MKLDVVGVDVWAASVQDRPGLGVKLTQQIADAGINLRGLSAAVIGRRAIFYPAFNTTADANKAMRRLKQIS